jgi:hypothetical protein
MKIALNTWLGKALFVSAQFRGHERTGQAQLQWAALIHQAQQQIAAYDGRPYKHGGKAY